MPRCSNEGLNIFYGFVRLRCEDNDSEIQVTLAPATHVEGTNSFVLVRSHALLIDFSKARKFSRSKGNGKVPPY